MKNLNVALIIVFSHLLLGSCSRDFLDVKPDKSLTIPNNLKDLQALLDNSDAVMNLSPNFGLFGSDDIYITDNGLASMTAPFNSAYLWEADFYTGETNNSNNWNTPYEQVFYANVVLETLATLDAPENSTEVQSIRGSAYFFRAFAFYQIAQLFCNPYAQATAQNSLGIPLRLSSDISLASKRSTIKETYQQILADLNLAVEYLPLSQLKMTRPTKTAAYALLARVHLIMADFLQSEHFATIVLETSSSLLNYNSLNPSANRPFSNVLGVGVNPEVLFYSSMNTNATLQSSAEVCVDTALYQMYASNDLRKALFFKPKSTNLFHFKGQYTGSSALFSGLAIDEVLLTRAECRARLGNLQGALADLNYLLEHRWKEGSFEPVVSTKADVVLSSILAERRKELVFRDLRWTDLRRLNSDPSYSKTLFRQHKGQRYTLKPEDPRYTLAIPPRVLMYSHLEQNPR